MGRQFAGNYGGIGTVYSCKKCDTYLTCHGELTSANFTGSTGPACLFKRVWNILEEEAIERKMLTGMHVVRDVKCLVCEAKVGWMYEFAYSDDQTYKEGQVILELALIRQSEPLDDPLGEDKVALIEGALERPRRQRRRNRSSASSYASSRSSRSI
ncbi:unnamed protein product [Caenorhabditis auriculariae]|uniref:Protein yippee-like n=1 Tax=Caenorhabditis auriculariae TaxID=2777116 RepID=A0A8S1H5W0_9PELO|nr:unnamed protein product [Caenorhabditis auriculariae]